MSHLQIAEAKRRLHRSELAVPGSRPELFEKAAMSRADYVFLDLEDAVSPDEKETARHNVIAALGDIDWRAAGKTVSVRINGLDTHYMYRDLIDVVEKAGAHLDTILVPKVGVPGDIYTVDALVTQIEQAKGFSHRIGVEALIETALGMANVEAVAGSSPRLEALHFGVADYAASCRARTITIGGLNPDYPGDQWHSALSRLLVACRANGLRAIDGRSGTSAIQRASRPRPAGPRPSATTASGPSTRRRSTWPTRCSPRRRPRWIRPAGCWWRWRRLPRPAGARLSSTGA